MPIAAATSDTLKRFGKIMPSLMIAILSILSDSFMIRTFLFGTTPSQGIITWNCRLRAGIAEEIFGRELDDVAYPHRLSHFERAAAEPLRAERVVVHADLPGELRMGCPRVPEEPAYLSIEVRIVHAWCLSLRD